MSPLHQSCIHVFLFPLARKVKEPLSGLFGCRVGNKASFSRVYYFFYVPRLTPPPCLLILLDVNINISLLLCLVVVDLEEIDWLVNNVHGNLIRHASRARTHRHVDTRIRTHASD